MKDYRESRDFVCETLMRAKSSPYMALWEKAKSKITGKDDYSIMSLGHVLELHPDVVRIVQNWDERLSYRPGPERSMLIANYLMSDA